MTMTNEQPCQVRQAERGSALVGVLLLLLVMSALAAALGLSGTTETLVTRNHQLLAQARANAEAGLNLAAQAAVDYLQTIDPVNIPATLNTLLADTSALDDGVVFEAATQVPGAGDVLDTYEVLLVDDDNDDVRGFVPVLNDDADPDNDENGDKLSDLNRTLVIRVTGRTRGNTAVVLEALIAPIELGAIVVDGDLEISGNVSVTGGLDADVHTNGDLSVNGGSASVSGQMTASGDCDAAMSCYEGAPEKPLPKIKAADYKQHADYVLSDDGLIVCNTSAGCGGVPMGGTVCDSGGNGKGCAKTHGWGFTGTGWSTGPGTATPPTATWYIEGDVNIASGPTMTITLIAEGSIDISGSPNLTAETNELLFVTDADLEISGGVDTNVVAQGQMLVHEQVKLSGNATLGGQLIVENAESQDPFVEMNEISGSVTIDYNGTLGTNQFFVTSWREVR